MRCLQARAIGCTAPGLDHDVAMSQLWRRTDSPFGQMHVSDGPVLNVIRLTAQKTHCVFQCDETNSTDDQLRHGSDFGGSRDVRCGSQRRENRVGNGMRVECYALSTHGFYQGLFVVLTTRLSLVLPAAHNLALLVCPQKLATSQYMQVCTCSMQ